jgi:hypothetical protein
MQLVSANLGGKGSGGVTLDNGVPSTRLTWPGLAANADAAETMATIVRLTLISWKVDLGGSLRDNFSVR